MATEYVDVAICNLIRGSANDAKELNDIVSINVTVAQESKVVYTMRRARTGRGYQHGARTANFEIESRRPKGGLEVPWFDMQERKEQFTVQCEMGDGGERMQIVDGVINEIQEGEDAEGNATLRIRGVCIDYRRDKSNPLPSL
jgi:hypothetical protein